MKVLGLGTYPICKPVHGGQRRVAAIADYYRAHGIVYQYLSVYQGAHYVREDVSALDIALMPMQKDPYRAIPLIDDLRAGWQAAGGDDDRVFERIRNILEQEAPDVLQIEQPFMWPLVKRLQRDLRWKSTPLIYSSQNVESPLKETMLRKSGVPETDVRLAVSEIDAIEREACLAASLVVACSEGDAATYRAMNLDCPIVHVPNGVSRPVEANRDTLDMIGTIFGDAKFLFFVGSAYPPNIEGFAQMVIADGIYFIPPEKSIAICGGLCDGVFQTHQYLRYLDAHSQRVQFFASPADNELSALKQQCHAVLLPITFGGGSNLKTAEAIVSGKWIVATPLAMRGFEDYLDEPGLLIADTPVEFRRACAEVLRRDPLELTPAQIRKRESAYWDRAFERSDLQEQVRALQAGPTTASSSHVPDLAGEAE